jgi:protein involved in polysaccharide export with SLBB domain
VFVSGTVFEAGAVIIGGAAGKDIDVEREKAMGYTGEGRRLSRAVQSAGGVRPDADLAHVVLHRGGSARALDIRPALTGERISIRSCSAATRSRRRAAAAFRKR